ncbi:MAG: restriction system modified-DNA reader domain-containing protein [Planctomycetota bacterium]
MENISRRVLEEHQSIIREYIAGKQGIYVLYKKNKLYYVGLATNLRGRLRSHLRNRHKDTWDRFSIYLTVENRTIPEIEAILIRIANPPGNKAKSKFVKSKDIKRAFGRKFRDAKLREIGLLLGKISLESLDDKKPKTGKQKRRKKKKNKPLPLEPFSKKKPFKLRANYKGKLYNARVRKDGSINYNGVIYNSPSTAGKAVRKLSTDGWLFWKYKNKNGEWVKIDELRKKKKRRKEAGRKAAKTKKNKQRR